MTRDEVDALGPGPRMDEAVSLLLGVPAYAARAGTAYRGLSTCPGELSVLLEAARREGVPVVLWHDERGWCAACGLQGASSAPTVGEAVCRAVLRWHATTGRADR